MDWLIGFLSYHSRRRRSVLQGVIAVVVIGLIIAGIIRAVHRPHVDDLLEQMHSLTPGSDSGPSDDLTPALGVDLDHWRKILASGEAKYTDLLDAMPMFASDPQVNDTQIQSLLNAGRFGPSQRDVAMALWHGVQHQSALTTMAKLLRDAADGAKHAEAKPPTELIDDTTQSPPMPWASYALGVWNMQHQRWADAAKDFEREGKRPEASGARERAVQLYAYVRQFDDLARLSRDPAYDKYFDASLRFTLAAHTGDWLGAAKWVVPMMIEGYRPGATALALFAALFWLAYLLAAGEVRGLFTQRVGLCLLGVLMGVVSVAVTLFLMAWQEQVWHLTESSKPIPALTFFLASVGLREEFSKFICFVPLGFYLAKRRRPIEWIIVAGCVGLGFAMEENVQYFLASFGSAAPARFVTANFFHIAATGLIGLAFCHFLVRPAERIGDFAVVFIGVVIAHGLYDALMTLPVLREYSLVSIIIFVGLAYQFFHELSRLRTGYRARIAPTAIFAIGLAATFVAAFNYESYLAGVAVTAAQMIPGTIEVALLSLVFLHEVPELWVD